jgi:hypothetical protein
VALDNAETNRVSLQSPQRQDDLMSIEQETKVSARINGVILLSLAS